MRSDSKEAHHLGLLSVSLCITYSGVTIVITMATLVIESASASGLVDLRFKVHMHAWICRLEQLVSYLVK